MFASPRVEFLEAGKKRLAGDTGEVQDLRRESRDLKEVVAEPAVGRQA